MLVIVCAYYSKQNFSFCVLFKVLTLPKGRKNCMHPLKHTSSCINFCPLNIHTHINTHIHWLQAVAGMKLGEISKPYLRHPFRHGGLVTGSSSGQEHPSACVKSC